MSDAFEALLGATPGLTEAEVVDLLRGHGFQHLVAKQKAARETYDQSKGGDVVRSVTMVEATTPSRKDEKGRAYLGYTCVVCGTQARIRQMKKLTKKQEAVLATQMALPNVTAEEKP